MDEKEKSASPPVDNEDLNTTAPNPVPAPWKMPQPVFRQTSGKLPRGFEKNPGLSVADTPQPAPAPSEVPVIEASIPDPATTPTEPKPKSPVLKIVVVLLGLGAMIAFLVVFLTLVYFLFLRS